MERLRVKIYMSIMNSILENHIFLLTADVLIEYIMINCYQEVKMQNIGTLLKLARTAQGLTQRDLARKAGLSQTAIARIESGRGLSDL